MNSWTYKVKKYVGKYIITFIEKFITISVKNDIYINIDNFDWIPKVEANFNVIKREYLKFKKDMNCSLDICKVSEEQNQVIEKNKWSFIPLYMYNEEIKEYTACFPETMKTLQNIPNVTTCFFSILAPKAFIKEHRGAYKGYLRYQLAISVPEPNTQCGIQIDGLIYHWEEGKSVIFDDTFNHIAWNDSNDERTVLYVDFIRPMPKILILISKCLTKLINKSPYVQNALSNLRKEMEQF